MKAREHKSIFTGAMGAGKGLHPPLSLHAIGASPAGETALSVDSVAKSKGFHCPADSLAADLSIRSEEWTMATGAGSSPLSEFLADFPRSVLGMANIDKMLHAVRAHLDMDVAFIAEFRSDDRIFRHVDARGATPISPGDTLSLDSGYCKRVVDGDLPELISDTQTLPAARALPETAAIPIGAHLSVPIRLENGSLYGTFCCFSFSPDTSLTHRDLQMMRAFAAMVAGQIAIDLERTHEQDEKIQLITKVLQNDQPSIVYQPIYNLRDHRVAGLECLSRFNCSPQRSPDRWFADAAEVGLSTDLETRAIGTALLGLRSLPPDVYLSVNSSPETIVNGACNEMLQHIEPHRLVLEITEHDYIVDYAELLSTLAPFRGLGMRVAIDDAGAGYASMRHILNIRPDFIKLDMSLTRDIDNDPTKRALASALIAFAKETGSVIVAEGVETASELQTLQSLGVCRAQGYFLSRPVPLDAAIGLSTCDEDPSYAAVYRMSGEWSQRNDRGADSRGLAG